MAKKIFLTTKEKRNFEKFFGKGLSVAGSILINLKEGGAGFLEDFIDYNYRPYPKGYKKYWTGYRFTRFKPTKPVVMVNLSRLQAQGLVVRNKNNRSYSLSQQGKKIIDELESRKEIFEKPWDKKFRLVFFDIPEYRRAWRRWLIKELVACRFKMLQKSTYIGKYPLPASFYQAIIDHDLRENVFVITAGEIDKQDEILELFQR